MNKAFVIIDYILNKYSYGSLPANPNTYQTWWGLFLQLSQDCYLTGKCYAQEKINEKGETEYHRIDPIKLVKRTSKETDEVYYEIIDDENKAVNNVLDFN